MGIVASHKKKLSRVLMAAAFVGVACLAGAVMLIAWAALSVDRVELAREKGLIERRTDLALQRIAEDINSAAIWNDSVVAMTGSPDLDWLQLNFGDYFADYMGHAATLILDGDGAVVLASRDSEPVAAGDLADLRRGAAALVARVRAESGQPAKRGALGFDGASSATGLIRVGDEVWLAGAATITPEDSTVRRPDADPIVVSGYPIDVLIASIVHDLSLEDVAFLPDAAARPGAALVLHDPAGEPLGTLAWTPERVGLGLLVEGARVMACMIALLALGWAWLMLWLRRTTNAMAAAEDDLIRARDAAQAANEAKSRFLANVSHELRTPLNGVVGIAEVMAAQGLSPDQRQYLDLIRASGARLTELIEELLQLSRLERGQVATRSEPFDLDALVETVVERFRMGAEAKGLELRRRGPSLGRRMGDPAHIAQALNQLMENAVTYTPGGRVELTAVEDGGVVRFTVEDTGPGLDPAKLGEAFGLFVQGDDSLTKPVDGLGAGLPLCRMLVSAMGGNVRAESTPGHGSRFIVELPLPSVGGGSRCETPEAGDPASREAALQLAE
ncbi:MAG: ATP-binding protein [Brevundimonas sp.]